MDRSQRSLQNAIKSRDDRISAIPTLVADAEARVEQRMERERQQHDTTVEAMKQKFARQQELISGFDKSVQEIKRLKVRLSKGSFGCKVAPHIKGERESVCVCCVHVFIYVSLSVCVVDGDDAHNALLGDGHRTPLHHWNSNWRSQGMRLGFFSKPACTHATMPPISAYTGAHKRAHKRARAGFLMDFCCWYCCLPLSEKTSGGAA